MTDGKKKKTHNLFNILLILSRESLLDLTYRNIADSIVIIIAIYEYVSIYFLNISHIEGQTFLDDFFLFSFS